VTDQTDTAPRGATGYRRLAGNTVATLVGRSAAIVLALILSTVLFRTLGRQRFGLWSLFAFLVGYSALIDFGLSAAVERHVAYLKAHGRTAEVPGTVSQALLLVLIVAGGLQVLVMTAAYVLDAWLGSPVPLDVLRGLRALPLSLALTTGALVVGSGLSGLQRMVPLYAWRTGGMAVGTAAVATAALAGVQRLDVLLVAYAVGAPVAAAGQWWSLHRELPPAGRRVAGAGFWRWHGPTLRQLVQFGGVLQVATIGPMCAEYAFRLVVSQRFGVEYAGIYDLAARAALGLRSLASALFVVMVPFGVRLLATADRVQASRLIRLAVKYTALFMLPSSALLFIVSDPAVHWWLGAGQGATQVAATLRPLVVLHALVSLTVPMAMLGRSAGKPVPEAVTTWAGVVVGLGISVIAPHFLGAVILFATAPLAAGCALWAWLAGRLAIRFDGGRDLLAVTAVTVAGGAASVAAQHLTAWGGGTPTSGALAAVVAGGAVALASTRALALVGPRERTLFMSLARPTEGSSPSPGGGTP
jgi:O-antigen/teichoic acid export membrane protein